MELDNPNTKEDDLTVKMKVEILQELKSDIDDMIQGGVLYDEETLYSIIQELMLSVPNGGVFLNPELVGKRNHVLIAMLKKQSDEKRINSVKSKIDTGSLKSEIQRRIQNLSNQNDTPEK